MILDHYLLQRSKSRAARLSKSGTSESPLRSVCKALSWRIIGTLDTLVVSYLLTGELLLASTIASVDFLSKLLLYFAHERIWNRISWGK